MVSRIEFSIEDKLFPVLPEGERGELKTRLLCGKEEGNNRSVGIVRVDLNRAWDELGREPFKVFVNGFSRPREWFHYFQKRNAF